jgi:hypothetical protein
MFASFQCNPPLQGWQGSVNPWGRVTAFAMVVLVCESLAGQAQKMDVTGTWNVTISLPDGQAAGYASLKQGERKSPERLALPRLTRCQSTGPWQETHLPS